MQPASAARAGAGRHRATAGRTVHACVPGIAGLRDRPVPRAFERARFRLQLPAADRLGGHAGLESDHRHAAVKPRGATAAAARCDMDQGMERRAAKKRRVAQGVSQAHLPAMIASSTPMKPKPSRLRAWLLLSARRSVRTHRPAATARPVSSSMPRIWSSFISGESVPR